MPCTFQKSTHYPAPGLLNKNGGAGALTNEFQPERPIQINKLKIHNKHLEKRIIQTHTQTQTGPKPTTQYKNKPNKTTLLNWIPFVTKPVNLI